MTLDREDIEAIAEAVVRRQHAARVQELIVPAVLTCAQFAERVGRSPRWVMDRCRRRTIKTVAGGRRPYRIPASELQRMLEVRR